MIFFRADSNEQIASGHIMRCLSLARAFRDAGREVCFLVADENPLPMLRGAGVNYHVLHTDWRNLSGEIEQVQEILQSVAPSVLLIDTYQVSRAYAEALKPFAKIVYLGSKAEYLGELDALINYSSDIDYDFYRKAYGGGKTKLLLGVSYAPLREEFQNIPRHFHPNARRVLLTTGASDPDGTVPAILDALSPLLLEWDVVADVVVGRMFHHRQALRERFQRNPHIRLHENVVSMSALMRESDLAVAACGTTVYELVASGVPVVMFAMAPEQTRSAHSLGRLGIAEYCGESFADTARCIAKIAERTRHYISYPEARKALLEKAGAFIDGNGCDHIVKELAFLFHA